MLVFLQLRRCEVLEADHFELFVDEKILIAYRMGYIATNARNVGDLIETGWEFLGGKGDPLSVVSKPFFSSMCRLFALHILHLIPVRNVHGLTQNSKRCSSIHAHVNYHFLISALSFTFTIKILYAVRVRQTLTETGALCLCSLMRRE